ncbi:MAG: FlgD immunoglobulin-like domain containing protein [Candidatus Cloacimonadaceae bacterium]|nr:FlgD immunoglobulin-like domain containing protein [Candidatus Cloacimonadaceae bacterium]
MSLTVNSGFTLTINSTRSVTVGTGGATNNGTIVLTAGTSTTTTSLFDAGNFTNSETGILTATGAFTQVYFNGTVARSFTNNGTVTAPLNQLVLASSSTVTLLGSNQILCLRVNLYYGTFVNSNRITFGTGGTSYGVVQISANTTYAAGSFDQPPTFNLGTSGMQLLYAPALNNYSTSFEVPPNGVVAYFLVVCTPRTVNMTRDITIPWVYTPGLNLSSGTLNIGANTLTINATIGVATGTLTGSTSSNIIFNGTPATTLPAVSGGLNNLTLNNSAQIALSGAVTVNGTLTLAQGSLSNGAFLTMASGTTISRSTGSLTHAPILGGTVNLLYTGGSPIATRIEVPAASSAINNLTTNTGGLTQSLTPTGGSESTSYTQGFNAATIPADWAVEIVNNPTGVVPTITFVTTGLNPTVNPNEGTHFVRFNSFDCESGDRIRLKRTTALSTVGRMNIGVVFAWYMDNGYTNADNVTVQWSTDGTVWNDSFAYFRYSATNAWVTNTCFFPAGAENQATLYIAFLFTSAYGNNCSLDHLRVNVTTPVASSVTVNGTLNLTGNYTIGNGNTLTIAGTVAGAGGLTGGATSDVTVSTGGNITLPAVMNTLTINSGGGVSLPNNVTVGSLTVASGSLNLNGYSLSFTGAPNLSFPGTGIVASLAATETEAVLMPDRINRQWPITGGLLSNLHATFTWTALDDNNFNWTGQTPAVYQGITKLGTVSFGSRTITALITSLSGKAEFTIGLEDGGTLPVELSSFTAAISATGFVRLMWVTQSETNALGYNIFRGSEPALETALQLNVFIQATNTSQVQVYQYTDSEVFEPSTYYYWLQILDLDGTIAFHGPISIDFTNGNNPGAPPVPMITELKSIYPNPFNPNAYISYSLDKASTVSLVIYNARGQIIRTYNEGSKNIGNYQVYWNGCDNSGRECATGVYFVRMTAGTFSFTRKAVLMK